MLAGLAAYSGLGDAPTQRTALLLLLELLHWRSRSAAPLFLRAAEPRGAIATTNKATVARAIDCYVALAARRKKLLGKKNAGTLGTRDEARPSEIRKAASKAVVN